MKDKENRNVENDDWFNLDQIKAWMKVSPSKKLDIIEQDARFLDRLTPPENKKAWQKLKEMGF